MTNKTKLVWRLSKLPTADELRELVKDKIITQEEAREILFSSETEEDRDQKSLKSEIKFLRELVEKLSKARSEIITTIREIEVPYKRHPWLEPYWTWCNVGNANSITYDASSTTLTAGGMMEPIGSSFSDIKTF